MKLKYEIEASLVTPYVLVDEDARRFEIKGICAPEDGTSFFRPIIQSLEKIFNGAEDGIVCTLELSYFNSSSLRGIYLILKMLDASNKKGKQHKIEWIVEAEDESMAEYAETLMGLIETPIRVLAV